LKPIIGGPARAAAVRISREGDGCLACSSPAARAAWAVTSGRSQTPEGHSTILAVNTLAPYMLTALIERPRRLVFLSSGMHRGGSASLRDIDWLERRWNASQAYSDSKLYVTGLAFAVARCWPDVLSHAVDPGWVATKMGGPGAPDDFEMGYRTQTWLAVSDDPAAAVSGALPPVISAPLIVRLDKRPRSPCETRAHPDQCPFARARSSLSSSTATGMPPRPPSAEGATHRAPPSDPADPQCNQLPPRRAPPS
jgi:NAD(P)-dependent dehydrogenase (short-subunit alcohol dehydrogenase family)